MTGPRSPAAVALADQAQVAGRDGAALLVALAGQAAAAITSGVPDGPAAELLARFTRRFLTGDITGCEHLSHGPEPSWWLPTRPGRLRCSACALRASQRTPRHRDRCDHCEKIRHPLHARLVLVPPIVLEDLTGAAVGVGPVTIAYHLCPDCRAASTSPSPEDQPQP